MTAQKYSARIEADGRLVLIYDGHASDAFAPVDLAETALADVTRGLSMTVATGRSAPARRRSACVRKK